MNNPANFRRYGRVTFLRRVTLAVGPAGPTIEASSVDISLGGVGLISGTLIPTGHFLDVAFHLKTAGQVPVVESVRGRVVHVRSDIDGHRLGVEFDKPLRRDRNPELTRQVENL